jgi:dolichol kinase
LENTNQKIHIKNELLRKCIHVSYSSIAFIYLFFGWELTVILLSLGVFFMISLDIARAYSKSVRSIYMKVFGKVLRDNEVDNRKNLFTGGTYLVISTYIIILFFPMPVAVTSVFLITYSDSLAAIIGKRFGRIKIFYKTLEGSIAFFLSGLLIIFLTPKVTHDSFELQISIFSLIVTTIFEVLPVKIDDNLYLPFIFSSVYFLLLKLFNLY